MAISKTQPMRSAEIEILVKVNALDDLTAEHTNSINTLTDGLLDETNAREQDDKALDQRITAEANTREQADTNIQSQIGNGFDSQNTITAYKSAIDAFLGDRSQLDDTVVDAILGLVDNNEIFGAFLDRFEFGIIENITIPANDSVSTSHVFATPFESTDSCILLAQVITSESYSLFTYTLNSCTYSGFSYSITNSDADAHTVALGFIAIKVN